MTDRPILFSGEMVRAILEGRKTQTRRVVKFRPSMLKGLTGQVQEHFEMKTVYSMPRGGFVFWSGDPGKEFSDAAYQDSDEGLRCPYGERGDRLWVRETFSNAEPILYRATLPIYLKDIEYIWKPSIFMPRWASRITLQITNVRVERVQSISEMDAMNEGLWNGYTSTGPDDYNRRKFAELWDKLNAKRGFGWDVNPWVWVIEFQKVGE